MATVKKEGSKVYIEGVPSIGWEYSRSAVAGNTYLATALVSCMKVLGEDIPYHFIMGTSDAAFRLKWRPGRWQSECGGLNCENLKGGRNNESGKKFDKDIFRHSNNDAVFAY